MCARLLETAMFEEVAFFWMPIMLGNSQDFINGTLQTHFPYNRQVDEKQMI
jgi:hypothetical protein